MTRIVITGAKGRMGQSLIACAPRFPDIQVVGKLDLGDELEGALQNADVLIDFSFHSGTAVMAEACARHKAAMIIGTTGHLEEEKKRILALTSEIPIVWASNYSTGVNTLFWLTRKAAEILGPAFDLEIVEMHHRLKKDAPSGTAMTLAEILAAVRNDQLSDVVRHGREGIVGERSAREIGMHSVRGGDVVGDHTEIGMHSVRGGDVVGDHTVIFAATGERVELSHKASNRDTFANGALRAALWVVKQPPGLYNMQHVLGLQD